MLPKRHSEVIRTPDMLIHKSPLEWRWSVCVFLSFCYPYSPFLSPIGHWQRRGFLISDLSPALGQIQNIDMIPSSCINHAPRLFDVPFLDSIQSIQFESQRLSTQSHLLLDLGNGLSGVQTLGAGSCAVENGVATVQAHAVLEVGLALRLALVTGVGEPSVRL